MPTKRVLIIDDEVSIQKVVSLSLQMEADWSVMSASSAKEGIHLAECHRPDVILLDVMMPETDGITTFEALQNNPVTQSIPVVLLTAKTSAADTQLFQSLSVAGVITKPFPPLALASKIAELVHWPL
ncbi:MAG: response regulator [Cyanobacteria bacterium J06560_2]